MYLSKSFLKIVTSTKCLFRNSDITFVKSSPNCTQDKIQTFLYFLISSFILSTPLLNFYFPVGPMNAPLLMELPLYSGQLSWEWDHSEWALQTHSPLPDIHSKFSMEWGSATGLRLAPEPGREARTREMWGKSTWEKKKNFFLSN